MLIKNLLNCSKDKRLLQLNLAASFLVSTKRDASHFKFFPDKAPENLGETTKMNLYQAVTNSLDISLSTDKSAGIESNVLFFFRFFNRFYLLF